MKEIIDSAEKTMEVSGSVLNSAGLLILICCTMLFTSLWVVGAICMFAFGGILVLIGWRLKLARKN